MTSRHQKAASSHHAMKRRNTRAKIAGGKDSVEKANIARSA
jgi:hypothetical protein